MKIVLMLLIGLATTGCITLDCGSEHSNAGRPKKAYKPKTTETCRNHGGIGNLFYDCNTFVNPLRSQPADIRHYYYFDKKKNRWIWSAALKVKS